MWVVASLPAVEELGRDTEVAASELSIVAMRVVVIKLLESLLPFWFWPFSTFRLVFYIDKWRLTCTQNGVISVYELPEVITPT